MNRREVIALAGIGAAGGLAAYRPLFARAQPTPLPASDARYLNSRDFGTKGDGSSDDTASLQKALDETFRKDQATFLVVPPGTYRISRTLRVSPNSNVTRASGVLAHGARLHSTIEDGSNVMEIVSRSTFRFLNIHGLEIRGSGKDGVGLLLECQEGGKYLYNFSLRDLVVQGCGGDGCRMLGNVFEGQVFNCYLRNNRGNGMLMGHGERSGILSAIHVLSSVFGENGVDGATMVNNCYDASFHGCYFLLNRRYGLTAKNGCTLLSHCGFENNHQSAADFDHGGAGLKLNNFGTLIACTAYSVYKQTALLEAFVGSRLVMMGCTGSGGGKAKDAILARIRGERRASVVAIGCNGEITSEDGLEILDIAGGSGGVRMSDRWDGRHHLRLGDYVFWVDAAGALRVKKGNPAADGDGRPVGLNG